MLHYERFGEGPTVVLLHGFLGSSKIYEEIKNDLGTFYDTILIDFAGHGHSDNVTVEPSIYAYAQQVVDILKHEKVSSATWLGHSMGGYIVLAALEKQLFPIEKAVLAYSSTTDDNEEAKAKRDASIEKIQHDGKQPFIDGVIPNFFRKNANPEHIERGRHIAYAASEEGLITALQTMKTRPHQQQLLDALTIPVLIIEGDEDGVVPTINTSNKHAQKESTPTGHLGMLEEPEQFMGHLKKFI